MTDQPTLYFAIIEHCVEGVADIQLVQDANAAARILEEAFGVGYGACVEAEDVEAGAWLIPLPKPLDALVDAGGIVEVTTVNGATVTVVGADA